MPLDGIECTGDWIINYETELRVPVFEAKIGANRKYSKQNRTRVRGKNLPVPFWR